MKPGRAGAGFTLIELMVVLALIAIMLGIAVPSFTTFMSNYRATTAANDLLQAVTLARSEALKRGLRVTVASISGDWRNGWTIFIDSTTGANHDQVWESGEELIYQHDKLTSTIAIAGGDANAVPFGGANYVAYDGTGYPRTANGSTLSGGIRVTDQTGSNTNQRLLCIDILGRPRVVVVSPANSQSCATTG